MKVTFLLALCLSTATFSVTAQRVIGQPPVLHTNATPIVFFPAGDLPTGIVAVAGLPTSTSSLLQKSRVQQLNGLAMLTSGSLMGWLGLRSHGNDWKAFSAVGRFKNSEATAGGRLALTGLVMVAGSIPYFIHAMKNKQKAGFRLACQKTSAGINNRVCRKVTGITYAIQIGR